MLPFVIKTVISSGLFYGLYYILLRKETYFSLNRLFLLTALVLSITIPLLHIPLTFNENVVESLFYSFVNSTKEFFLVYFLDEVVIYGSPSHGIVWTRLITATYIIGVIVFSIRIPIFLYQMSRLHKKSRKYTFNGISIYVHSEPFSAFSYWNNIYVNREELSNKDFKIIWRHEVQHIRKGHTFESFLLEIWSCLFWFNPFIWLIKEQLKEIHEFQTDISLVNDGVNNIDYQKHLLNYTIAGDAFMASSNFATTALKRRIKMLSSKRSSVGRYSRLFLMLPTVLLLLAAFSFNYTEHSLENNSIIKTPNTYENHIDTLATPYPTLE